MSTLKRIWLATCLMTVACFPRAAFACAACFGKSDSSMARGMNMGIFSLLGVIVGVLATFAGFFIYLARRSAKAAAAADQANSISETITQSRA